MFIRTKLTNDLLSWVHRPDDDKLAGVLQKPLTPDQLRNRIALLSSLGRETFPLPYVRLERVVQLFEAIDAGTDLPRALAAVFNIPVQTARRIVRARTKGTIPDNVFSYLFSEPVNSLSTPPLGNILAELPDMDWPQIQADWFSLIHTVQNLHKLYRPRQITDLRSMNDTTASIAHSIRQIRKVSGAWGALTITSRISDNYVSEIHDKVRQMMADLLPIIADRCGDTTLNIEVLSHNFITALGPGKLKALIQNSLPTREVMQATYIDDRLIWKCAAIDVTDIKGAQIVPLDTPRKLRMYAKLLNNCLAGWIMDAIDGHSRYYAIITRHKALNQRVSVVGFKAFGEKPKRHSFEQHRAVNNEQPTQLHQNIRWKLCAKLNCVNVPRAMSKTAIEPYRLAVNDPHLHKRVFDCYRDLLGILLVEDPTIERVVDLAYNGPAAKRLATKTSTRQALLSKNG